MIRMKSFTSSKIKLCKRQAGRLLCLLVMLIMGASTITATGLLVRSQKAYELNRDLTSVGDYDGIIYDAPSESVKTVSYDYSIIKAYGSYIETGYVSSADNKLFFKGAAFRNKQSEQIYHMPCIRGNYPRLTNEIALDVSTARALGISPYPGETVTLNICDEDGNAIKTSDFVISGVFEASSDMVWGGWFRYPSDLYDAGDYMMPSIFFFEGLYDSFLPGKEVLMFQAQGNASTDSFLLELNRIKSKVGNGAKFEYNESRAFVIAYSMGILDELNAKKDGVSFSSISKAINDKYGKKDIFSSILIPLMSIGIMIIVCFTTNMLVKAIIADRKEYYGAYRLIGVSSKDIAKDILIEFTSIGMIGTLTGVASGIALHQLLIQIVASVAKVDFESGLKVSETTRIVTFNPLVLSILVCIISVWLALISPVYRISKFTPIELLAMEEDVFIGHKKGVQLNKSRYNDGWLFTFSRRIDLHDTLTMITLTFVLSVMLFGYCYFCAYSEKSTSEYQGFLEANSMDGFDYVSSKSKEIIDGPFMVSNRHSSGISRESVQAIESADMTDELCAVIRNSSTRLLFKEKPDSDLIALLGNHNLKPDSDDSELGRAGERGSIAAWKAMGFDYSEYMYELPTVGVRESNLIELSKYVVAGRLDLKAIASGKEVVVAVPEYLLESALKYYGVGTTITFSDILMSAETEELDFNSFSAYDAKYHVYDEIVKDESGNEIETFATAYGLRHDITATIGAIVVLDDSLCNIYLNPDSKGVSYHIDEKTGEEIKDVSYGMALLVDDYYTFNSWGLPDTNYTKVMAALRQGVDVNEFDQMWYKALSKSKNVETNSTYYYLSKIKSGTTEVMSVYYLMSVCLVILGAVSVSVGLYARVGSRIEDIMKLRRIGLSAKQSWVMILFQNIYYPIVASIISIIPVIVCQSVFSYILNKLRSGEWEPSYFAGQEPWYISLPYSHNLFEYNFALALGVCALTGIVLIVVGTIPQIIYLNRHKMIESEE